MTLNEHQSFLSMACKHDCVDIIQSILTKGKTNASVCATPDQKNGGKVEARSTKENFLELLLNTAPFENDVQAASPTDTTELMNGDESVEPVKQTSKTHVVIKEEDDYLLVSDEEYEYYEEEVRQGEKRSTVIQSQGWFW